MPYYTAAVDVPETPTSAEDDQVLGYTGGKEEVQVARTVQTVEGFSPETPADYDFEVGQKEIDSMYELEKQDPKHRMGNYLYILKDVHTASGSSMPFFSWVDIVSLMDFRRAISARIPNAAKKSIDWWNQEILNFQKGVKYKGESAAGKYRITIQNGLLHRIGHVDSEGHWINTNKLEPFDTGGFKSHWSGDDWAIWVESEKQTFYSNRMKVGKIQHTSFLAGAGVRGAGEWKVTAGKITMITGRSGHYKPTLDHLVQALRDLKAAGVDITNILVRVFDKTSYMADPIVVGGEVLIGDNRRDYKYKPDPAA